MIVLFILYCTHVENLQERDDDAYYKMCSSFPLYVTKKEGMWYVKLV